MVTPRLFRSFSYRASCWLVRLILFPSTRLRVFHEDRVGVAGGAILAANHISHFDPPVLSVVTPRKIDWMAMEELFRHPWSARLMRSYDAFPVQRGGADRAALRIAVERLQSGALVGIFPEGGLRAGAESILEGAKMRPGIGLVAGLSRVPIVPVIILGTDRLYDKRRWLPWKRTPVWVYFGRPLSTATAASRADIQDQLAAAFLELKEEMRAVCGIKEADMPKTPQYRKGELP